MLSELVRKNRSYRRFNNKRKVSTEELVSLVDLARHTASARNVQPLKYMLINNDELCDQVFPLLAWAGYLSNWKGPEVDERPSAYIVVINDNSISKKHYCDEGIAMQTMLLGAVEKGLGGCMLGSFNKSELVEILELKDQYEVLNIVAIGEPVEEVVLREVQDGETKYWRDDSGKHYVPKRSLEEIIISK